MNWIKKNILFLVGGLLLTTFGNRLHAQQALIDVQIDSAAILIGEQTVLHLTVTTDKDRAVQLVIPRDTLMRSLMCPKPTRQKLRTIVC